MPLSPDPFPCPFPFEHRNDYRDRVKEWAEEQLFNDNAKASPTQKAVLTTLATSVTQQVYGLAVSWKPS